MRHRRAACRQFKLYGVGHRTQPTTLPHTGQRVDHALSFRSRPLVRVTPRLCDRHRVFHSEERYSGHTLQTSLRYPVVREAGCVDDRPRLSHLVIPASRTEPEPDPAPTYEQLLRSHRAVPAASSLDIADGDTMYHGGVEHYQSVGVSAWRCITAAMLAADAESPKRVLDMPSGHGRVLRVLRSALPDAHLTACDIEKNGVDYCAATFGATPVYSDTDLDKVRFEQPFDLIWCGSLLTHLDVPGWLSCFKLFVRPAPRVLQRTSVGRSPGRHRRATGLTR